MIKMNVPNSLSLLRILMVPFFVLFLPVLYNSVKDLYFFLYIF